MALRVSAFAVGAAMPASAQTFQRNALKRNAFVSQHVQDRWISQFRVEDGVPEF
jgi:hypothetical protein